MSATGDRGFATSGAYLLVGVAAIIAVGSLHTAVTNSAERVSDAQDGAQDRRAEALRTDLVVTAATWDGANTNLTVRVENTGETAIDVADTDLLVDGRYAPLSAAERVVVEGRTEPAVVRPGETLAVSETDRFDAQPGRVKTVGDRGVADTREVTA